jgi:hypothetical protein
MMTDTKPTQLILTTEAKAWDIQRSYTAQENAVDYPVFILILIIDHYSIFLFHPHAIESPYNSHTWYSRWKQRSKIANSREFSLA